MSATLASVCLALFCLLGIFDGLYFHLIRFQLHSRLESRTEHLIHTARAFVFVPIALFFFAYDTRGPALLFGLGIVWVDLCLEVIDILIEKKSRQSIGGVSSAETAVHVFASSFRMAALAFVISAKPMGHFDPTIVSAYRPTPFLLHTIGMGFAICSLAGGVLSLRLISNSRSGLDAPVQKAEILSC